MKKLLKLLSLFFSTSAFSQVPNNGLIAFYPFNGNYTNVYSNINNGAGNAFFTKDRKGTDNSAVKFLGNENILLGNITELNNNGPFTISFWINSPMGFGQIFSKFNTQDFNDFNFLIANHPTSAGSMSSISFYCYSNLGFKHRESIKDINDNHWHHVIITYNLNTINLFIDGYNEGLLNTGQITNNNYPISLGGGELPFNGSLDDVRIYNRVLSDIEIQQLYQAESPPIDLTTGLVAHYKMDGNAHDASGNSNHGTAQNGVTFGTDRFGNTGKAASFDGEDDWISTNFPSQTEITNQYSISSWIFINDFYNQAYFPILEKPTTSNEGSFNLLYVNSVPMLVSGALGVSGINTVIQSLNKSQWYNIITTYNGSSKKFFLNGVIIGNLPSSGLVSLTNTPLNIGKDSPGLVEFTNGKLDDIRIYNRALSDSEIAGLYAQEANPNTGKPIVYQLTVPTQIQQGGVLNIQLKAKANNLN